MVYFERVLAEISESFVLLWEEYFLSYLIYNFAICKGLFVCFQTGRLQKIPRPLDNGYNTDTLTSFSGIDNVSVLRIKG